MPLPPHFTSSSLLVTLVLISSTHSGLGDSPQSHPLATPRFPHVFRETKTCFLSSSLLSSLSSPPTEPPSLPFLFHLGSWLSLRLPWSPLMVHSFYLLLPLYPHSFTSFLRKKKSMESNLCCPYTPGCGTRSHKARTGLKLYVSKNNLEPLIPLPLPLKCWNDECTWCWAWNPRVCVHWSSALQT